MRSIGCLAVIALVCVGIFLLASSADFDEAQKGQWIGEKAHRGWNHIKKIAGGARKGWKTVEDTPSKDDD